MITRWGSYSKQIGGGVIATARNTPAKEEEIASKDGRETLFPPFLVEWKLSETVRDRAVSRGHGNVTWNKKRK